MIQNIQFPEGTVVRYQRGSILDQFSPGMSLNYTPTYGGGAYEFSQLYSAREYTGNLDYCFRFSNVYYKLTEPKPSMNYAFTEGHYLYDLVLDKNVNITKSNNFLSNAVTKNFMKISANITGTATTNFMSYTKVKYLDWDVDTSSWSSGYIFGNQLVAMNGYFSMASYNNVSYYSLTGFSQTVIRKFTIKDLGTKSSFTSGDFTYWIKWGVNHSSVPDARQSLIDSLITYSFDRAAAGYSNCTIKLAPNTKALLTEEEIAQITAKGFTIA